VCENAGLHFRLLEELALYEPKSVRALACPRGEPCAPKELYPELVEGGVVPLSGQKDSGLTTPPAPLGAIENSPARPEALGAEGNCRVTVPMNPVPLSRDRRDGFQRDVGQERTKGRVTRPIDLAITVLCSALWHYVMMAIASPLSLALDLFVG
jgi:hypothetical protein